MDSKNFNIEPRLMLLKRISNELEKATFNVDMEDMPEARKVLGDLSLSVILVAWKAVIELSK